jgi:glucan phosphoethanolaminetransferase (alkaline phosphatase superfamily)
MSTSSPGAAAVVVAVVVVVVVVVAAAAGADVVWAWILAQADIAATNTATSRECLGVYFIVWGVVWLLG